jgi:hypothetical protein
VLDVALAALNTGDNALHQGAHMCSKSVL